MLTHPLAEHGALVLDTTAISDFTTLQAAGTDTAALLAMAAGANAACIMVARGGSSASDRVRKQPVMLSKLEVLIFATATAGTLSFTLALYGWHTGADGTKRWHHIADLNGGTAFSAAQNPREFYATSNLSCATSNQVDVGGLGEYFAVVCSQIGGTNARVRASVRQAVV